MKKSRKLIYKNVNNINKRYFCFLVLVISICYSIFGNFPNNWGDPLEYLGQAENFRLNLTRFIGYPLFIKIFSLNLYIIFIIPIIQTIIFIFSLILLESEINKKNKKSYLIYLLSAFPDITYMHTLIFPDSLVLSLLCFYIYFLIRKKILSLVLISILLFLLKSYLIFIIIFTGIIIIENKFYFLQNLKIKFFFPIIIPVAFYLFLPNHLAQPFYAKIKTDNLIINYKTTCDSKEIILNEKNIFLNKRNILDGNILRNDINLNHGYSVNNINLNQDCFYSIEKEVSRHIINQIIINHLKEVVNKIIFNFISSFVGLGIESHVTSMIGVNLDSMLKFIKNDEINGGLDYKNIFILLKNKNISDKIVNINTLIDKFYLLHIVIFDKIQIFISIILFVLTLILYYKKKNSIFCDNILALSINFSIMHSIFALVISDRYIFFVSLFYIVIILHLQNARNKVLK